MDHHRLNLRSRQVTSANRASRIAKLPRPLHANYRYSAMPNKRLRIIIADDNLARLINVEKTLNRLGYFRILPLQKLADLRALDHEAIEPFDVIIAYNGLILSTKTNFKLFTQATQKTTCTYLYGNQQKEPSHDNIQKFMAHVDPPSQWECLKYFSGFNNNLADSRS